MQLVRSIFLATSMTLIVATPLKAQIIRDVASIEVDHPDEPVGTLALMRPIGTTDLGLYDGPLGQLIDANKERDLSDRVDDSASNSLNKLARTFAAQIEALKPYRSGSEQKVTVQHARVAEGWQAIVGNVNASAEGGKTHKTMEYQLDALIHLPDFEMPSQFEEQRNLPTIAVADIRQGGL